MFFFLVLGIRSQDPCLTHDKVISDTTRNVSYKLSGSETDRCDRTLSEDWYQIQNKGDMPTICPAVLSCGTTGSIWINGKHCDTNSLKIKKYKIQYNIRHQPASCDNRALQKKINK